MVVISRHLFSPLFFQWIDGENCVLKAGEFPASDEYKFQHTSRALARSPVRKAVETRREELVFGRKAQNVGVPPVNNPRFSPPNFVRLSGVRRSVAESSVLLILLASLHLASIVLVYHTLYTILYLIISS